ncbi:BrnA antitoxin family protein [Sphingomonas sp. GC_Shp_6]|uniref:BrnA antitoxin family protein n=1 Tax=Sphingomonas sp. GC_Shp_6 TaxID=2937378 RepID=UPI00226A7B29|nr:BrnA antitoxin family protein [Sphingomonas sp. GC_Shp_6]
MTASKPAIVTEWVDPDDAPEWTDEMFDAAEIAVGGKVVRPATGHLGPNGIVRGRPPQRDKAKQQVTLRLDADVLAWFRESGPGWQGRLNEALRKIARLS